MIAVLVAKNSLTAGYEARKLHYLSITKTGV